MTAFPGLGAETSAGKEIMARFASLWISVFLRICKLNKTNHMATGELLPPTSFIMAP